MSVLRISLRRPGGRLAHFLGRRPRGGRKSSAAGKLRSHFPACAGRDDPGRVPRGVDGAAGGPWIANLGHGILPDAPSFRTADLDRRGPRLAPAMTVRIAVVGAGISGLSTHWFLEREPDAHGPGRPGGDLGPEASSGRQYPHGEPRWLAVRGGRAESILNSVPRPGTGVGTRPGGPDRASLAVGPQTVSPLERKTEGDGAGFRVPAFPTWSAKLAAFKEPFVGRGHGRIRGRLRTTPPGRAGFSSR